jgi:hypothetical protein
MRHREDHDDDISPHVQGTPSNQCCISIATLARNKRVPVYPNRPADSKYFNAKTADPTPSNDQDCVGEVSKDRSDAEDADV